MKKIELLKKILSEVIRNPSLLEMSPKGKVLFAKKLREAKRQTERLDKFLYEKVS